jgi:peptide-methionine (S)-S-oxide reductase
MPTCRRARIWTSRRRIEAQTQKVTCDARFTHHGWEHILKMKWRINYLLAFAALNFSAPAQPTNSMNTNQMEIADLGGGCFWCMEAVFERLPGVISVTSGFAGGHTENPTYQEVCTETTGHAEVTQIVFDPAKISYDKLLDVFWQAHDPTTLNRQGADVGTSYRSIILYRDEKQKLEAEKSKLEAQKNFKHPIVTEIVPLKKFYPAEDYHQEYYDHNSNAPYCQVVIAPKLEKLEKEKVIQPTPQTKP